MTFFIQEIEWTEQHKQRKAIDSYEIRESELYWVARQPFFESRGYQLRPRYRPGWVKSWTASPDYNVEDSITCAVCFYGHLVRAHSFTHCSWQMPILKVMDATRVSDGRIVILKRLNRIQFPNEIDITRYLSQEGFLEDKRNHCVSLLDIIDPGEGNEVFLVMPLLRPFDSRKFESLDDVVDFIHQMLEVCCIPKRFSRCYWHRLS